MNIMVCDRFRKSRFLTTLIALALLAACAVRPSEQRLLDDKLVADSPSACLPCSRRD
jgi:hypothetical protein